MFTSLHLNCGINACIIENKLVKNSKNGLSEMQTDKESMTHNLPKSLYSANKKCRDNNRKCSQTEIPASKCKKTQLEDLFRNSEPTSDESSKETYNLALNYINTFHCSMNEKLKGIFGDKDTFESGDRNIFRFPEVPNYMSLFDMLTPVVDEKCMLDDGLKNEQPPTKSTKMPDIKKLPDQSISNQNENPTLPEKNSTMHQKNNYLQVSKETNAHKRGIYTCQNNQDDLHSFVAKQSTSTNASQSRKAIHSQKQQILENSKRIVARSHLELKNKCDPNAKYSDDKGKACANIAVTDNNSSTDPSVKISAENNSDFENTKEDVIDLVKNRFFEVFLDYFQRKDDLNINHKDVNLVRSCFNVVNINPQINLLEYARKKLEKKTDINRLKPKSRKEENRSSTPKKVKKMFEKISHEKNVDDQIYKNKTFKNYDESDNESVIFDDDEFEQMSQSHHIEETKIVLVDKKKEDAMFRIWRL